MKEFKEDIKNLIEQTSNVIKKHQIKELGLNDWSSFEDPRYKEGKIKEKAIQVLEDLLEIKKETELLKKTTN